MSKMIKKCPICKREFRVKPSHFDMRITCSLKCKSKRQSSQYKSKNNPNWRGGKIYSRGYILIYKPNHPSHDKDGYIREHRLAMENYLARRLSKSEVVHHINGIKDDNRIENLQLFKNHSEHFKHEIKKGNIPLDYWKGKKFSESHRKKVIKTLVYKKYA